MDNLGGLRTLVDRMGLPPRILLLIAKLEQDIGPIDQPPANGIAEVKQVIGMVDGGKLLAAIVAHMLGRIPDDELPPADAITVETQTYQEADYAAASDDYQDHDGRQRDEHAGM